MSATARMSSPLGELWLRADSLGLCELRFASSEPSDVAAAALEFEGTGGARGLVEAACDQLGAWFARERMDLDLPTALRGTEFQRRVWARVAAIPRGATQSYRDIAVALGAPGAERAVGAANAKNPLPIIIPCHRVVGADGRLTGYSGGLERKRWLLEFEGRGAQLGLFESAHD